MGSGSAPRSTASHRRHRSRQRPRRGHSCPDAPRPSGRGFPRAGRGRLVQLRPHANLALGLHPHAWLPLGVVKPWAAPRRSGAARRWPASPTAVSTRAASSMARSATACRWAPASSARPGWGSGRRSTVAPTGWGTVSALSSAGTCSSSSTSMPSGGRGRCSAAFTTGSSPPRASAGSFAAGARSPSRADGEAKRARTAGSGATLGGRVARNAEGCGSSSLAAQSVSPAAARQEAIGSVKAW